MTDVYIISVAVKKQIYSTEIIMFEEIRFEIRKYEENSWARWTNRQFVMLETVCGNNGKIDNINVQHEWGCTIVDVLWKELMRRMCDELSFSEWTTSLPHNSKTRN